MHRPQEKRISEISLWVAHKVHVFIFLNLCFTIWKKLSLVVKANCGKYSQFFSRMKFRGCTIWANTRPLSISGIWPRQVLAHMPGILWVLSKAFERA